MTTLLSLRTALEFIYAQSPESMKGFLTGVFYFAFGLSSLISSLAFYEYTNTQGLSSLLVYHVIFTGIQVYKLYLLSRALIVSLSTVVLSL